MKNFMVGIYLDWLDINLYLNSLVLDISELRGRYTEHDLKRLVATCSGKLTVIILLTSNRSHSHEHFCRNKCLKMTFELIRQMPSFYPNS